MSLFEADNDSIETATKQHKQEVIEKKTIKKSSIKIKDIDNDVIDNTHLRELKQIHSFSQIEDRILQQFENNKLHHAVMFSGDYGIGKATFAYFLISKLILSTCKNNQNLQNMHLELLKNNTHPDVFFLTLQNEENEIKIEQVRAFLNKLLLKSTYGNKFVLIDDINSINLNGINALLKTLEEPPENTYFFIINHNTTNLLDTIYSRCNEIKLSLKRSECVKITQQLYDNMTFDEIEFYTDMSSNSIGIIKLLFELDIKQELQSNSNLKLQYLLNNLYKKIEIKYKNLSRNMIILLLEKILIYCIKQNIYNYNNDNIKQIISNNNSILKQFQDIKRFELPILFI